MVQSIITISNNFNMHQCTVFKATFSELFWTFHTKSHNMETLAIHWLSPFLAFICLYGKMNFCGSLCGLLEYLFEKELLLCNPCKSHDHDHQWADLVMAWLQQDKRKCEHKVVCLHFTQNVPMSSHGIGYKQTWYPPDVR